MRGVVIALLLVATVSTAESPRRYSGKVERIELGEGLVVVVELAEQGRPRRHDVYVATETPIVATRRLRSWEMHGARLYGEQPVSLADLLTGDFVVVESVEEAGRTVARRITIVEVPRQSPAIP